MEEHLASIISSLSDIKTTQSKLIQSFNEQNKTTKNFSIRFDNLSSQIKKLSNDNALLNGNVSQLELKMLYHPRKHHILIYLINEIAYRQSRINNIILFNFPEAIDPSKIKPDSDRLKLIFNEMKLNIEPIRFFRLGNPSTQARPLKITLTDTENVFNVLRAQSKIRSSDEFKELRFSSDHTVKQREQMSILRQELETRRSNGENNIIIKYI